MALSAERYFSKNDDFYSEENISIHTLENWEVVVDDEVEKQRDRRHPPAVPRGGILCTK